MDRLRALRSFVAIVDHGSLSAAARALDTSLPATVRLLAELERSLGTRLLHRTTRRIALTDEGRVYLERCRGILAELEAADAEVAPQQALRGELCITAPVLMGQRHLAQPLARFVAAHPALRCRLLLEDRLVDLIGERVDVAVRVGVLPDSNLIAVPVGRLQRVVVASPAYLARHGVPMHPRELAAHNCIRFPLGHGGSWSFRDGSEEIRVPVRGSLEFNHSAAALEACIAGAGIGMFGAAQVAGDVAAGRLEPLLQGHAAAPVPVQLVYPGTRWLPPRTRAFVDCMKTELGAALRSRPFKPA